MVVATERSQALVRGERCARSAGARRVWVRLLMIAPVATCAFAWAAAADTAASHDTEGSGRGELFYTDPSEDDDEDADLFADDDDEVAKKAATTLYTLMLEPFGFSVAPVNSYGIGVSRWLGRARPGWAVRLRYARGAAALHEVDLKTELTTVDLRRDLWGAVYATAGLAYRNVRARPRDGGGESTSKLENSASAIGGSAAVGVERTIDNFVVACELVGVVQPWRRVRDRGPGVLGAQTTYDERRIETIGQRRSLQLFRLVFGPRF